MDDSQIYLKAMKNALELVKDRKYTYDTKYDNVNEEEAKYLLSINNLFIIGKNDLENKKIIVKMININKVKSINIKEIYSEIINELQESNETLEIILVLKNKPTSIIKKLEKEKDFNNLQIMYIKQFMFNPTKHKLVPKHTKISIEEENAILKEYALSSKNQLPVILKEDPIVRYYNFKAGDILKINSSVGTMNTNYIYYRCVR